MLAATYLAVQYMLALRRVWFLPAIGLVAAIEPVLLLQAPKHPASFATVVLLVQLIGAAVAYAMRSGGVRRRPRRVLDADASRTARAARGRAAHGGWLRRALRSTGSRR